MTENPDSVPCAGVVTYDENGNYVRRSACEAHLFDEGVCPWQATMQAERDARYRTERMPQ